MDAAPCPLFLGVCAQKLTELEHFPAPDLTTRGCGLWSQEGRERHRLASATKQFGARGPKKKEKKSFEKNRVFGRFNLAL